MKRLFNLIILTIISTLSFGQNTMIVNDSAQYGFNFPRIKLLSNDVPYVIWGKPGSPAKLYGAKLIGANFSNPVEITPDSVQPRIGLNDGPDMVAIEDSIFAVWMNENPSDHHVFISKSIDGGNSFSTPIQVDSIITTGGVNNIEYPGISVSNTGDLGIYFIKSDAGFLNPRQSLITSFDKGQSFSIDSVVNSAAPGRPCECCQGSMEMEDTTYVFYYRNNDNNVRNAYNLVSFNKGNTFDDFYELDTLGWNINYCPSSGPVGHLGNNKSVTAWMTGASGNTRILYNSVDIGTQSVNDPDFIDANVPSFVTQNFPSAAGSGDTVVIAWQDNRYIFNQIFASVSIDGGQSFIGTTLISDTSITGTFTSVDVAYAKGIFHFTWRSSSAVYYRAMNFAEVTSVNETTIAEKEINLFPNPSKNYITIESNKPIISYSIYDINGKLIQQENYPSNRISVSNLQEGIYFLIILDGENVIRKKIVRQ